MISLIQQGKHFFGKGSLIYVHLSYNYYKIGFCSQGLLVVYGLGCCFCYVVQFYFCFDNVFGKPIINKYLFYIVKFIKEDSSEGRQQFNYGNKCFYDGSFKIEEAFTREIESAGINVGMLYIYIYIYI